MTKPIFDMVGKLPANKDDTLNLQVCKTKIPEDFHAHMIIEIYEITLLVDGNRAIFAKPQTRLGRWDWGNL